MNYSIDNTSSVHSETSLLSSSPSLSSARIKRVVSLSCDEDGSSSSRRRESNNNSKNNVTFNNNKNKHENDSNNPTAVPNKRRRFMRRGSRCPSMFTVLPTTIINDPDDDDDKIQPNYYYSSSSAVVVVDCNSRHSHSHSRQEDDDDDDEFVSYYRCSTRRLPITHTAPPRIINTISPNNHFSPTSSKKSLESMSRKMASLIIKANNIMDSPSTSPSRKKQRLIGKT